MSLVPLSDILNLPAQISTREHKNALAFVFNSDFLVGFQVLCYSLAVHRTLTDLPILIITEDKVVLDDPFVRMVADKTKLATEEEIRSFSSISSEKVDKRLQLEWIPKYTYMKWLMFDDYGFDNLIFIDTDIVCLNSIDELDELNGADLFGCPVFSKDIISKREELLGTDASDQSIKDFSCSEHPAGSRLNTGVMVVGDKLLTETFRKGLIEYAEAGSFSVEQAALREYIRKKTSFRMEMISPLYNFKHDFIQLLSVKSQVEIISRVKLLHYAGAAGKPWETRAPTTLSDFIWHCYYNEAKDKLDDLVIDLI